MRKLLFVVLLASGLNVQAENDINYNYLELGYGYIDIANSVRASGLYLDGAFELSDRFYIGGSIKHNDYKDIGIERYNLNLGFHTNGSGNTDFYTELGLGRLNTLFNNNYTFGVGTLGLYVGTRTAFNDRFELISKIGQFRTQTNYVNNNRKNIFEAGIKGIFKFSNSHAMTLALETYEGDSGINFGYRYSK